MIVLSTPKECFARINADNNKKVRDLLAEIKIRLEYWDGEQPILELPQNPVYDIQKWVNAGLKKYGWVGKWYNGRLYISPDPEYR